MSDIDKYNNDMKKLVSTLNAIIESGEYTMLVESFDNENTLEYGIIGQKMQAVEFNNLNGESFWEFMYKGIYSIKPNCVVHFMNIDSFGNKHSSVIIDVNDKVEAIIANIDHKYDNFILKLHDIMKNSEDVSKEENGQKKYILSKIMKPLS